MEPKRLYRKTSDKVIAGVCSGLGDYLVLDPLLVRLIFIVLSLAAGGGVLAYIILWIAMPDQPLISNHNENPSPLENPSSHPEEPARPAESYQAPQPDEKKPGQKRKGNLIGGLVLITLGFLFLADEFIPNIRFGDLWPVILVVIGIGLLINGISGKKQHPKN
jgi:phage shock protein C